MPEAAYEARIARTARLVTKDQETGYFIVPEPKDRDSWFVWDGRGPSFTENSVLVAKCGNTRVLVDGRREPTITCRRVVAIDDFSLSYSFYSPTKAPAHVDFLDKEIKGALTGWGCMSPAPSMK